MQIPSTMGPGAATRLEKAGPFRQPWLKGRLSLPRSLSGRLILGSVGVVLVALTVLSLIVHEIVMTRMLSEVDERLQMQASELRTFTRLWEASGHTFNQAFYSQLTQAFQAEEVNSEQPILFKLMDKQSGAALAHSANFEPEQLLFNPHDFSLALQLEGQPVLNTRQDTQGKSLHTLTMVLQDEAQQTVAVAQLSQSLQTVERVGNILTIGLILASLVAVIIAYGINYWLTRRELKPLQMVTNTMHRLEVQQLEIRLEPHKQTTEIQLLNNAFNQMLERLQASFGLQRSFVTDVSHELRTPLTAIRGQLDVLLLNPRLEDEARQDVQQINGELQRLSRLVANLLTNGRIEVGQNLQVYEANRQMVELDLLLIEVARQGKFLNRQVEVEISQLVQAQVPGDADLLKQLLFNLVDNAMTYTPAGGRVSLALDRSRDDTGQEWASLTVTDTGPGIEAADLPHIFGRHYRCSQATARSKLGAGLGLFIADTITQAHAGTISVKSQPAHGTCFTVRLPLAPLAIKKGGSQKV